MALLKIVTYPDAVGILRTRCKPVMKVTRETRRLISNMIETMRHAAGLGLAAPQVGVGQRLFVYDVGEGPEALINPEIVQAGEEIEVATEGCLSIPRLQGDVPRHKEIQVTGLNRAGKPVRLPAQNLLARVFQHEIDHLNGVLFVDRAVPDSLHWLTEEEEEERVQVGRRRSVEAPEPEAVSAA
ncbi:MAG: peptide deformylase [Armatimonadetes bacterium]|nr:peptide deformylase [Armatimonadota bacterium]